MDNEIMEMLSYPFDPSLIMRKRKSIKRKLLEGDRKWTEVKIAILGGSTTNDIQDFTELFLLAEGIKPVFYASEYGKYWEDGMFGNPELDVFEPQIVFIHTSVKNINELPDGVMSESDVEGLLESEYQKYESLWENIFKKFDCTIIQNNFDRPMFRLLGNQDICNVSGNSNFVYRLNGMFYDYARQHKNFFIHDIDYLSADYGLTSWHDGQDWSLYKSAFQLKAGPAFGYSLSRIIKSIYGKNKKALALDLDNTLWGGVIGDDGVDNIEMGTETAKGEGYHEFQDYVLKLKNMGIILAINSKNDEKNALGGLNHPDCLLKPEDFVLIKANWMSKDQNMVDLANEIDIGIDSILFIDDNPAERQMVHGQYPDVTTPEFNSPEECIQAIDGGGYFEISGLTEDDKQRNAMYKANVSRKQQEKQFASYDEYLESLDMVATIKDFEPVYISRIAQLTNKTNQFNLTTARFSEAEIEAIAADENYIRLYCRLEDKFGDNGLISVVFGKKDGDSLNIEEWLMSCRVLKRDVEKAMLDALVEECNKQNIKIITGKYIPTAKNGMVKDLYKEFGFKKISEDESGSTEWEYQTEGHIIQNRVIKNIIR